MKRSALSLLSGLWLVLLVACGASAPDTGSTQPSQSAATSTAASATDPNMAGGAGRLNVFAAASLAEAFGEIGRRFDAASGAQTSFNFAGSQQLAQQIAQGAPADVFASANRVQMESVIASGQVLSGTQRAFAHNRLVVVHPRDNPARITRLEDLARPGVKLVLAASAVPVGQYSLDFLSKASALPQYTTAYSETVLRNVVSYEENVRAVLSKVVLGEADAGIVYSSDIARDAAADVGWIDIPDELNTIASYPIATIADAPNAPLARKFVEYVLSPEAQQILAEYGFISAVGCANACELSDDNG
ncbi:MAG TPA: molybdate ABC transporter substrate-binding protein [Herpetosiphonaceae bacterium]